MSRCSIAIPTLMLLAALMLLTACEERAAEEVSPEEPMPQETTPAAETTLPDTTAEAVWEFLQTVDYEEEWRMWPDKTTYYEGTEPHGVLLTTYVNDVAHDAVVNQDEVAGMPDNSFIIKENYTPDSTLAATTIMYRVAGYDAQHNDWYWAKYTADGTVEAAGRVESCQSCHSQEEDENYLRTDPF